MGSVAVGDLFQYFIAIILVFLIRNTNLLEAMLHCLFEDVNSYYEKRFSFVIKSDVLSHISIFDEIYQSQIFIKAECSLSGTLPKFHPSINLPEPLQYELS